MLLNAILDMASQSQIYSDRNLQNGYCSHHYEAIHIMRNVFYSVNYYI